MRSWRLSFREECDRLADWWGPSEPPVPRQEGCKCVKRLVDLVRFEFTTSSMPWKRAPNCATGPRRYRPLLSNEMLSDGQNRAAPERAQVVS